MVSDLPGEVRGEDDAGQEPEAAAAPVSRNSSMGGSLAGSFAGDELRPIDEDKDPADWRPRVRSASAQDVGARQHMEDFHLAVDDLSESLRVAAESPAASAAVQGVGASGAGDHGGSQADGDVSGLPAPAALYLMLDGHSGPDTARFAAPHLRDSVTAELRRACTGGAGVDADAMRALLERSFAAADADVYQATSAGEIEESGATALLVLLWGRRTVVANLGDCRGVLSRRGRAVDLSQDHDPGDVNERARIEEAGGFVDDGYGASREPRAPRLHQRRAAVDAATPAPPPLTRARARWRCARPPGAVNGELSVARALGDFHHHGMKRVPGDDHDGADVERQEDVLSARPDVVEYMLQHGDEFMVLACDGLWSVFSSQSAIEHARIVLRQSKNDPQAAADALVKEALKRHTTDNVSVLVVCLTDVPPPRSSSSHGSGLFRSVSVEGFKKLQDHL